MAPCYFRGKAKLSGNMSTRYREFYAFAMLRLKCVSLARRHNVGALKVDYKKTTSSIHETFRLCSVNNVSYFSMKFSNGWYMHICFHYPNFCDPYC